MHGWDGENRMFIQLVAIRVSCKGSSDKIVRQMPNMHGYFFCQDMGIKPLWCV